MNPLNLILRFLLEVVALIAAAVYGATLAKGWLGILTSCSLLFAVAALWVIFNVPGDQSRSGKAPVVVPGIVRLILELLIFGFGSWCLFTLGYEMMAAVFAGIVFFHYVISYNRILWLLKR